MPERNDTRQRFGRHTPVADSDQRDRKARTVSNWTPSESQKRFLEAYAERSVVASAARRAGVARCTVYRWLAAIPAFEKALREAYHQSVEKAKRR
jgi:hypothetical protein